MTTPYSINSYADAVRLLSDHPPVVQPLNEWSDKLYDFYNGRAMARDVNDRKNAALDAIEAMPTGRNFDVTGARKRPVRKEIFPPGCNP